MEDAGERNPGNLWSDSRGADYRFYDRAVQQPVCATGVGACGGEAVGSAAK